MISRRVRIFLKLKMEEVGLGAVALAIVVAISYALHKCMIYVDDVFGRPWGFVPWALFTFVVLVPHGAKWLRSNWTKAGELAEKEKVSDAE